MFYKYCGMSGRVVPSSQQASLQPQGLAPYSGKVSQFVFSSVKTQPIQEAEAAVNMVAPARGAASSPASAAGSVAPGDLKYRGTYPNTASYKKILDIQNVMLKEDGKMVWQKLGRDRIGYGVTLALMVVGTALTGHLIYRMAFNKKK